MSVVNCPTQAVRSTSVKERAVEDLGPDREDVVVGDAEGTDTDRNEGTTY